MVTRNARQCQIRNRGTIGAEHIGVVKGGRAQIV